MKSPDAYPGQPILTNLVLLDSAAQTETGTGASIEIEGFSYLILQLDVTAAATEAGDTLDVFVQTTIDVENWVDIYHFTQVLGDGGAKRYFGKILRDGSLAEFENGTALSAGGGRAIFGDSYRVRWDITDASTDNASFTFSVKANAT